MLCFDFCFQDDDPHGAGARLLHSMSPLSSLNLMVVMVLMTDDRKRHEILMLKYHRRAAFRIVMFGSVVTLPCLGIEHKITYKTETLF